MYADDKRVFRIEDGETHHVVATSKEHALEVYALKTCGYKSVAEYLDDIGGAKVRLLGPLEIIRFRDEELDRSFEEFAFDFAAQYPVGLLCSTCV